MKEHRCEKCEHEKECLNMVCFYELLEKEEEKIRADERAKVLDDVHKAMANKYHCREDMCEVGMTCADCLKEYMNELYKEQK